MNMTQEQLNNYIAEDLNKWQPIIEYARIFLDEDKALRDRYKWLLYIKRCLPWSLIISLLGAVLSFYNDKFTLSVTLGLFSVVVVIAAIYIWRQKDKLSKLVDEKDRMKLEHLMDSTNKYLSKLKRWLAELDSHSKVSAKDVSSIEKQFIEVQAEILPNENVFSIIHGNLVPEWNIRAKQIADERLKPLKQYIYE